MTQKEGPSSSGDQSALTSQVDICRVSCKAERRYTCASNASLTTHSTRPSSSIVKPTAASVPPRRAWALGFAPFCAAAEMGYLPIRERRPAVACLSVVLVLLVALCGPVGLGTVLSWVFGLVLTIVAIACSIYGAVRSKTLASLGMRTPQGRLEKLGHVLEEGLQSVVATGLEEKGLAHVRGGVSGNKYRGNGCY